MCGSVTELLSVSASHKKITVMITDAVFREKKVKSTWKLKFVIKTPYFKGLGTNTETGADGILSKERQARKIVLTGKNKAR